MKAVYGSLTIVLLILTACNNPNSQAGKPHADAQVKPAQKNDSAHLPAAEKQGTDHQSPEDTIILKGPYFDINGIQAYWAYTVKRRNRPENPAYNLQLIAMQLKSVAQDIVLFNPAVSFDLMNDYYSTKELQHYPQALLECKDINKDAWCDYEVLFERAAAGANTTTDAFLFNPEKKTFAHSKLFSGTNVEYDSVKNMIKTFWKMGYGDYTYTYTYLKTNRKEISYIMEEDYEGNKVTVTKIVKGKIVKKKTKFIEE
jgi:hypothetical protein